MMIRNSDFNPGCFSTRFASTVMEKTLTAIGSFRFWRKSKQIWLITPSRGLGTEMNCNSRIVFLLTAFRRSGFFKWEISFLKCGLTERDAAPHKSSTARMPAEIIYNYCWKRYRLIDQTFFCPCRYKLLSDHRRSWNVPSIRLLPNS